MNSSKLLAKLNETLGCHLELTYPFITPIGILAIFAFPAFLFWLPKTETVWLDAVCTIAAIILLIIRSSDFLSMISLSFYWLFFIILVFPFNFTYNLFVNSHSIGYELGEITMLMVIFTLIPSTLLTLIVLFSGIGASTVLFFIEQNNLYIPTNLQQTLPWYLLAIILGFIFSDQRNRNYQREKRQARQLESMRNQLTHLDRNDSIKEAILGVAHELNQPLGAIENYISVGIRYLNSEYSDTSLGKLKYAFEKSREQVERAAEIVLALKNFLCYQPSKLTTIEINKVIEHVVQLMQPRAREAEVQIQLKLRVMLPKIKCNQTQLELVLTNLITNAIEAIDGGNCKKRRVLVTTRKHLNQQISLMVEDTGPGIDDNIKEKLFFPFVTNKKEGVGLGLSLSYNIIQRLGGRIEADSVEKKGSRFTVILPTT